MAKHAKVVAWQPAVAGIGEVFHARFAEHAYPIHTHDSWTLLVVDRGVIGYRLDRHEHSAEPRDVLLLPPHVPHDGRTVHTDGFRKRVLYLDTDTLDARYAGSAVDNPAPSLVDRLMRARVHRLHVALAERDDFEAQSRLAMIVERLEQNLRGLSPQLHGRRDPTLARRLRELLDASTEYGITLDDAANQLAVSRVHLIRSFGREFGIPPHLYLTGRRVDLARHKLLAGQRPSQVATEVGFYDQSHLTRHFKRMLGVSPAAYANHAAVHQPRRAARRDIREGGA